MFTQNEIDMLKDALDMAMKSNKRLQADKPKYAVIFNQITDDINALVAKLNTMKPIEAKPK